MSKSKTRTLHCLWLFLLACLCSASLWVFILKVAFIVCFYWQYFCLISAWTFYCMRSELDSIRTTYAVVFVLFGLCFHNKYGYKSVFAFFLVSPSLVFRANNAKINFREKEKKLLDQILGAGKYDARIRPSGINGTGKCGWRC